MTLSAYRDEIPDDLPPAPRYVLHMLLLEGAMTLDELRQYTQLPTSTLTSALDRRGETISITIDVQAGSERGLNQSRIEAYRHLRNYLSFANSIDTGTTDRGVPWYRERLPARAPVETQIVPIEPGPGVSETDGLWVAIVGGDDETDIRSSRRRLTFECFVLAPLREYFTREDLADDLASEVI